MIWVDREIEKIKKRGYKLEWVDDMKTPSGRIHVGALRGVIIHDLLHKVLSENEVNSKFTYVFDDHDPMDAIPSYLNYDKWEKYAGMPLYKIPSPEAGFESYAEYYAKEFEQVFNKINCRPEIIWGSELYLSGKMNETIKIILDNTVKIRKIYLKTSKIKKADDWYPFNVICEKCGKIGTTQVYDWDGKLVSYKCQPKMVAWAVGCGNEGKVSPYDGKGKMPWKVEWACKWKVIGVTVEAAGKDHMSAGGSYDIASAISREILKYKAPYAFSYEWFIIGGKKMSSSKGVGTSAKEVAEILPPDIFRFLLVRTPMRVALDFNPYGDTILNLFDDYDRCMNAYFDKIENKIADDKKGEVLKDFARIIELSSVRMLPDNRLFLPRFRTIVNLIKTNTDLLKFFEDQKGIPLNPEEKEILEEREVYAKVYLDTYAKESERIEFTDKVPEDLKLTAAQNKFLEALVNNLNHKSKSRDEIQETIFTALKAGDYKPREVFSAFYKALINKDFGPKAADLILDFGVEKTIKRLKEAIM